MHVVWKHAAGVEIPFLQPYLISCLLHLPRDPLSPNLVIAGVADKKV